MEFHDPDNMTDRELLVAIYKILANGFSALEQVSKMMDKNPLLRGMFGGR